MGHCVCKNKAKCTTLDQIRDRVIAAIESGRVDVIEHCYEKYMLGTENAPALDVDEWIIELQSVKLNSLAYAFRAGQTEIVKFLLETAHASLSKLYAIYKQFNRTPVDLLCEYGFLTLLQYFLPIHLQEIGKAATSFPLNDSLEELSIFSDHKTILLREKNEQPAAYQPSIHRACEKGHLTVVQWLLEYFQGQTPPSDFDVNAVDDKAGENSAFVAARMGNIHLLKLLHSRSNVDFHLLNRRNENAIQVAATGSKRKDARSFYECIRYLVEVIGVDVTYNYEETLLICEDRALVGYLEGQLRSRGIDNTKEKLENEYSLTKNRGPRQVSKHSLEFERKLRHCGFKIKDLVEDGPSRSYISSIPQKSLQDISSFSLM